MPVARTEWRRLRRVAVKVEAGGGDGEEEEEEEGSTEVDGRDENNGAALFKARSGGGGDETQPPFIIFFVLPAGRKGDTRSLPLPPALIALSYSLRNGVH